MKISLSLKAAHVTALAELFTIISATSPANNRHSKTMRSVIDCIAAQILKKHIDVRTSSDLFNQKRRFKMSLQYHEASFLETMLGIALENPIAFTLSEYNTNAILIIKNNIDQQLQ